MAPVKKPAVTPDGVAQEWQYLARSWALRIELRPSRAPDQGWLEQWHLLCSGFNCCEYATGPLAGCGKSLVTLHDGSVPKLVRPADILRVVTHHLMDVHEGLREQAKNTAAIPYNLGIRV